MHTQAIHASAAVPACEQGATRALGSTTRLCKHRGRWINAIQSWTYARGTLLHAAESVVTNWTNTSGHRSRPVRGDNRSADPLRLQRFGGRSRNLAQRTNLASRPGHRLDRRTMGRWVEDLAARARAHCGTILLRGFLLQRNARFTATWVTRRRRSPGGWGRVGQRVGYAVRTLSTCPGGRAPTSRSWPELAAGRLRLASVRHVSPLGPPPALITRPRRPTNTSVGGEGGLKPGTAVCEPGLGVPGRLIERATVPPSSGVME
ncbi:hypothetical protein C8Q74DRAFT_454555 [Fomes fomentarius]|nr:hypothetical protein C8Q74DRAFT_454555 [Fomes fomentarius]